MFDLRKIVIIFVIAVLFSILVHSTIDAFYPAPERSDFCKGKYYDRGPYPVINENTEDCEKFIAPSNKSLECRENGGFIDYTYDNKGCPIGYECNMCDVKFEKKESDYNLFYFIVVAISSLIAISLGLFLPETNHLNTWIGTGFMLGGLFMLFFSTMRSYDDLIPVIRPIVILIELLIVLFVSYKTLSNVNSTLAKKKKR